MTTASLEGRVALAEQIAARSDLRTADPYDLWKTPAGFRVKDFYNRHRRAGLLPAAVLSVFDLYVNNRRRWLYTAQEYPIARAWAALVLLARHATDPGRHDLLATARQHIDWLLAHASPGYGALCWGIGFRQPISAGLHYPAELPLASMTPYPVEALARYARCTADPVLAARVPEAVRFFLDVLPAVEETDEYLVPAYSPLGDRRVINVASYALVTLAQARAFADPATRARADTAIRKLYAFIRRTQRRDGSWLYALDGPPFIDCFHSCIVLKNLIKASGDIDLPGVADVVARGCDYVFAAFRDPVEDLYRRFAVANKPSPVRFDLYDNAEVISLLVLRGDIAGARALEARVAAAFVSGTDVYSAIDRFGLRRNVNHLRWAVLPYLHAVVTLHAAMTRSAPMGGVGA